jgi:hypothetical protein
VSFAAVVGVSNAVGPQPDVPGQKPWVLLPTNLEEVPPEYLADGTETLDSLLAAELTRRGLPFVQLTLVEGLRRWMLATRALEETEDLEQARERMIQSLLEEFAADGVVWPDVILRFAIHKGRRLSWDGVSRTIPGGSRVRHVALLGVGSSLRVRLFGADAGLLFDAYGGLEAVNRFQEVRRKGKRFWWEWPVRSDLFHDRSLLSGAIRELLPDEIL